MPLDGHQFLVNQGWRGKGTGLREDAITRPLAIQQKKNLAGLGNDRDEAFPFWDHLFSAASKAIQIKCLSDDEDGIHPAVTSSRTSPERTSTGILSNRRPIARDSAIADTLNEASRLDLITTTKRAAAKRNLYSRFFRGPTLGPEVILENEEAQRSGDTGWLTNHPTVGPSETRKQKRKFRGKHDGDGKREKKKHRKGEGEETGSTECKRNIQKAQHPISHGNNVSHRKRRTTGQEVEFCENNTSKKSAAAGDHERKKKKKRKNME